MKYYCNSKSSKRNIVLKACLICTFAISVGFIGLNQIENKPKVTYMVGGSKVTVWENKTDDGRVWKNFKVEKVYKKEEKWETTNTFDATELLQLRAAIDEAINEEIVVEIE